MSFFEDTHKPQGFCGKLMAKSMNIGHAKLARWGFSLISVKPGSAALDVGCGGGANIAVWLDKCGNGSVAGVGYSGGSVEESKKAERSCHQAGEMHSGSWKCVRDAL